MSRPLLLLCFSLIILLGCSTYQVEHGVVRGNGSVLYPLCEKAKYRIVDMQRISFELPPIFKQAPCRNWPDYSYSSQMDELVVEIPGVIINESQVSVGGTYGMSIHAGSRRKAHHLSPETFWVDYEARLKEGFYLSRLVTASWVSWTGGRCARFFSDKDTGGYLLRVVDYFCWETVSGAKLPIHIHATQKQPPGYAPTDLDKELIEPVLASLRINPVPPERLALWARERDEFCTSLKNSYDEKKPSRLSDDLGRQRLVRYLRDCGYTVPEPVKISRWGDIFKPDGQLVGQAIAGNDMLRKVSPAQFAELEAKLMSLQPKPGARPQARPIGPSRDGKGFVELFRYSGPYDGQWYYFPPNYSDNVGIGIREDALMGRMMDIYLWDGGIPLGLKIVSGGQER